MSYAYECTFELDDCLRKLGLDERGRVQQAVDSEVLRVCDPFLPFDTGALRDSGLLLTDTGSGEVVWACGNKARRLYYGEESWNWSNGGVQEGGLRGPYWVDRAMEAGGMEQVEEAARKEVKK